MYLALLLSLFTLLNGACRINGGEPPDPNPWSNCEMENWQLKLATGCKSKLSSKFGTSKVGGRFKEKGGNGLIANECARDGEFKSLNALRITEFDGHVTMESSSFIMELNDTFRFTKEPKHLNISGAFSNVAAALGEEFHQAISWGAWTEGYEFATRIIAMELHSAIANDDGTNRCKKKCALLATALPVQHYGIKCTQVVFPADIAQMTLNVIISSPYEEACLKYEIQHDIGNMTYDDVKEQEKVDACNKVSTKCEKPYELFVCFKSWILNKKISADANLMILQKCRAHFGQDSDGTAGFRVHICTRRDVDQLIIESIVDFSFTDKIYKRANNFSITFGAMSNMNGMEQIFFMEFGNKHQPSAIRQNEDGEPISDNEDEIGALLASIAYDLINGSEAKQLHFIPNFGQHIHIFFQIPGLGFSKRITQNWNLDGYQNDPKKSYKPVTICDLLDDDCVPVRELMAKISAYQNWCDPDNPSDPCIDPPIQDTGTERDPLDRMGDKIKSKEQVQSLHEKYRIKCAKCKHAPKTVGKKRLKRQFAASSPWSNFPIQIRFDWDTFPKEKKERKKWIKAVESGAKMIMDATCVNFTFIVSAGKDYGINITNGGGCSSSSLGKKGGWQKLTLASECIEDNGGIAAHELLHALGLDHEHQRNDARNFTKINYYHKEYKDWASQLVVEQNTGNFDFPYDYGSIMHYPSVGPAPHLIITHSRFYQKTIGQSVKLSFKDAAIIDHAYCKDACKNEVKQCLNNGYPNPKRCLQCRCPDGYGGAYCESIQNNWHCIDGNERELEADWQTRTLKPVLKCGDGDGSATIKCRCHWIIKPKHGGKTVRIQLKDLSDRIGCDSDLCSRSFIEIKYRKDKSAQGARLCCSHELSNEINLIYADGPDTEIVIILNIDNKVDLMADTQEIPFFELTYESDEAKIVPSGDCLELLFDTKRNPKTVAFCYRDPLTGKGIPCCPEGQGKCPLARRSESRWGCKVVVINGQYKEVRGLNKPKEAYFQCFKREGESTSFWGYWNDKSKDPMYVDDFQCLTYEEAGIEHPPEETSIQFPLKFKSAYNN